MSRLRWLTAGESHGPALVATLEGLPSRRADHHGDGRRPPRAATARLWAWCAHEVRARRGHLPRWCPARPDHGLPGRRHGGQHGVAEVGAGHVGRPGRPGDPRGPRPQRPAHPPAPRPRRPRRDAEVRLRRGPADPGARLRAGDGRPRRAGRGGPVVPEGDGRHRDRQPRRRAGRRQGALRRTADPRGRREAGRRPGPLPRRGRLEGDGRGDRPGPQGRRHPRRRRRGAGVRRTGRPRLARALGPCGSTPASPRP